MADRGGETFLSCPKVSALLLYVLSGISRRNFARMHVSQIAAKMLGTLLRLIKTVGESCTVGYLVGICGVHARRT